MKPRPVIQGVHLKPVKAMTVSRKLFLSQELNARIRAQHDRLRKQYDSMTKSLRQFMVDMLEAYVGKLEEEAEAQSPILIPKRPFSDKELTEIQGRLRDIKGESVGQGAN